MKKRRHKSDKNNIIFQIIIMFVMIISGISVGYSLLSTTLSVTGKGNLVIAEENDDIKVEYTTNSWFNAGTYYYQIQAKITNMTSSTIEGWEIVVPVPNDVTNDSLKDNCWSMYCTVEDGNLHITNSEYNGTLAASGGYAEFGFILSTTDDSWDFSNYTINGETPKPSPTASPSPTPEPTTTPTPTVSPSPTVTPTPSEDVNVSLSLVSSWGADSDYTKQYTLTINNPTDMAITSWKFDLIVPEGTTVGGAWSINYIEKDGIITISNGDWNGSLNSDGSTSVTIQLHSTTSDYTPTVDNIIVTY